jgi:uncharacterized protein YdiU (UPF0061 family)
VTQPVPIAFDNSYAALPDRFYARVAPSTAEAPQLIELNIDLARELGFDPEWLCGVEGIDFLSGKQVVSGSQPIATAYAGHQFGNFVPQLGDGRAILLGEVIRPDGQRRDLQLKGAGATPFSRGGDGKAALGPVLREYVISEAMGAMGIPTTRALAALATGQTVIRERVLPGAVLVRVASSHIRVGTFQYFAVRGDTEALRMLADHVIARHYPAAAEAEHPYRELLASVMAAQAKLIARWLQVGFIHGVMNTDNMAVAGETIDYGPCAFMDAYDPAAVFSSIDRMGRYAYANQPSIGLWNLTRLAETLLPLLSDNEDTAVREAEEVLSGFAPLFQAEYLAGFRTKLGLFTDREEDGELIRTLLDAMARNQVDFTLLFRRLVDAMEVGEGAIAARSLFAAPEEFDQWADQWRARLQLEAQDAAARRAAMRGVNPAYIPRNHRIEAMIAAAVDEGDFAPMKELLQALAKPFDDQPGFEKYQEPPSPDERVLATFCGT